MLNGVPAVWVPIFPPPAASTLNFVTRLVKVTVIFGLLLVTEYVHGDVVPEQPVKLLAPLQPVNVESVFALADRVPVALLLENVIPVHVLLIVWDVVSVPVPPQEIGALTVPAFGP